MMTQYFPSVLRKEVLSRYVGLNTGSFLVKKQDCILYRIKGLHPMITGSMSLLQGVVSFIQHGIGS